MLLFDRLKAFFFKTKRCIKERCTNISFWNVSLQLFSPTSIICSILSKLHHCSCSTFLSDSYTVLCSTWLKIQANPCLIGRCKQLSELTALYEMLFSKPFDEAITVKLYFYLSTVSFLANAVFMKHVDSCIVCYHKAWLKSSFREIWFLALSNGCSQMVTAQQHGWNGLDGEKWIFFFFLSICYSCLFVSFDFLAC